MKKWEIARYLIDAKKCIDSMIFIRLNIDRLNIDIRSNFDAKLTIFYIKLRVVYDKCISRAKLSQFKKNDIIIAATYYEVNKNHAHKDDDYVISNYTDLSDVIDDLIVKIEHCKEVCSSCLPSILTLDFVPHDKELYRLLHGITSSVEEEIKRKKHPLFNSKGIDDKGNILKAFHDTEEIKNVVDSNQYGVVVEEGINYFEGIQNRQDFCIKVNVLFDHDSWYGPEKLV